MLGHLPAAILYLKFRLQVIKSFAHIYPREPKEKLSTTLLPTQKPDVLWYKHRHIFITAYKLLLRVTVVLPVFVCPSVDKVTNMCKILRENPIHNGQRTVHSEEFMTLKLQEMSENCELYDYFIWKLAWRSAKCI